MGGSFSIKYAATVASLQAGLDRVPANSFGTSGVNRHIFLLDTLSMLGVSVLGPSLVSAEPQRQL